MPFLEIGWGYLLRFEGPPVAQCAMWTKHEFDMHIHVRFWGKRWSDLLKPSRCRRAVLRLPALRYTGKISYGMYLFHFPLFLLIQRLVPALGISRSTVSNLAIGLLQITAATLAASIPWRFFESPILSYKKKFQSVAA